MADIRTRFMEAYAYLLKEGLVTGYKDFASKISVSTSMITEISKERSNVGMTAIQNIVTSFPINADWLLTGRGSMLIKNGVQQPCEPVSASSDAVAMRLMDKLDQKESKIDHLQSELRVMGDELATLKAKLSQYEPEAEVPNKKTKGLGHAKTVSTEKPSSLNADNATSAAVQ